MSSAVPEGWSVKPLSDYSERIRMKNSTGNTNVLTASAQHGLINQKEYFNKSVASKNTDNYTLIKRGDFAYNKSYSNGYPVGVIRRLTRYESGILSPLYICFSITENECDKDFVSQFFDSYRFERELNSVVQEGARAHGLLNIPVGDFFSRKLLLPPLPEQQKIASILSSVDDVIEKTTAQIDKLKDLKTGMMQELLTKGIGHTEFKDSPVGRIPVGWEVKSLEDAVNRIIDCEHKTAPYVDKSEYLVARTSNVRHGELVHDDMKFTTQEGYKEWTKRAVPCVGDILFTREAPAGESCMIPDGINVCMGQRMVLLRPNEDVVYPSYFSLFLISEIAELAIYELSIGTTVSRINIEDIKRIPCVIPPVMEQKEISTAVSSVQTSILKKQAKLQSLKSAKKALMQDLLTGNIRVEAG